MTMSELANQERATKQRWAVPGSSHDRVVRFAKIALPSAVGVVIAFLAMAPLDNRGDVSFILDKNQVENAPERMRVEQARYVGEDNRGQKFQIVANRALQRTSEQPIVDIWGMLARFGLSQGPVTVAANQGQLQSRPAEGRGRRAGAGDRARGRAARHPQRHGRPQAEFDDQPGAGRRQDGARPVPGGQAARRSQRAEPSCSTAALA